MGQPDTNTLQSLAFRCIGPPRGGRVVAVAGHPTEAMTFYFGACAGGVWKTVDGGTYWENTSDGFFTSSAVGALAVAESDPNVIYAGMGEATIRLDVSYGDGVYRSTDGGKTWANAGLRDTHHIGRIQVHPHTPDIVYVAALGHAFGPNQERGVFRSMDGGQSWEKVLFVSDKAGAVDLILDRANPRVLYAAIYEVRRTFWSLSSGGPDSGLWKSTDGGDTWVDLSANPGIPAGLKGKIGVTVSPARPDRVWAILEMEGDKGGVYRSDDGGQRWEQVSTNRDLLARPWYYCHIFADPQDPDTVYINNLKMWKSTDGGRTYSEVTTPHGDNHDLWVDPRNPQRMINGNDGGACVSFNGGDTWSTIYNQLTAQFYHLAVDNQHPYRVYGTQQDNSSISVPSASEQGAIPWTECYAAGTGESGYIAPHPLDPNIVYVGAIGSSPGGGNCLQRYDHRTRQIQLVTTWPEVYLGWGAQDMKYRFAWTYPIVFSPHDAGTLYVAGNHIFRTTDEGASWEVISPDLSRNDVSKLQPSGGPITLDTSGAETYATVFAFVESPHEPGVFWAGTDDGLIHLSRDGGSSWQNVTPPDLPEWALVSIIEASPHDPATAYVAVTRYKLDDYSPYLFRTADYGQTWQRIDAAFPTYADKPQITRVIREDPAQPGLLYVGTETGVYYSLDGGDAWQRLPGNLPVAPVYDLLVKDGDLVIATHGRSFWILDDVTPLREWAAGQVVADVHLFAPRPTVRQPLGWEAGQAHGAGRQYAMGLDAVVTFFEEKGPDGELVCRVLDGGENPPDGVIVYYTLPEEPPAGLQLTFLSADKQVIRSFNPRPTQEAQPADGAKPAGDLFLPSRPGLNRFVWDMRYPDATRLPGDVLTEKAATGPRVAPGAYLVQLTAGEWSYTARFTLKPDPRVAVSQADFAAQLELGLRIRDKLSATHEAVIRLRSVRQQVEAWTGRAKDAPAMAEAAAALVAALTEIETALVQTGAKASGDRLRLPSRLNAKLVSLIPVVSGADAAPTQQAYAVYDHLASQVDEQLARLQRLLTEDVAAFNRQVAQAGLPAVA